MTMAPPLRRPPAHVPVEGVAFARYRSADELAVHLGALNRVTRGRLSVVLAYAGARPQVPSQVGAHRVIATGPTRAGDPVSGWHEPDPFRATLVAFTGLEPGDAVLMLFPVDWAGPAPELLVERARRWRASPHSPNDDVYFG
jgi:hypothetical protein